MTGRSSILAALAAALLFGASTPFAKQMVGDVSPIMLAGLLYLGSGIGLWTVRLIRDRGFAALGLPAREWPWLLGAIASGGVLGPLLLMIGLAHTTAADASLLLNMEAVLTAVLAWVVFRENADRRIVLGIAFIVAGGLLLAWPQHDGMGQSSTLGSLAVFARQLPDLLDRHAADLRGTLWRPLQGTLTQCAPARGVALDVIMIEPVVTDQLVHDGQSQRRIRARQQSHVLMAFLGRFAAPRIDTPDPSPEALGLLHRAPKMQIAGNRVAAPDHDQTGLRKKLHLHPDLAAQSVRQGLAAC